MNGELKATAVWTDADGGSLFARHPGPYGTDGVPHRTMWFSPGYGQPFWLDGELVHQPDGVENFRLGALII